MQAIPANEILLNNQGASLLERKRYESAVVSFTAAIKQLVNKRLRKERMGRAIAATFKATGGNPTNQKTFLHLSRTNRSFPATKSSSKKQEPEQDQAVNAGNANTKKPLELNSGYDDIVSSSSPEDCIFEHPAYIDKRGVISGKKTGCRLAVILLYNLGVANHLWALYDDDLKLHERSQMLKKAFAFYRLSCIIQVNEDVEISTIYSMALLNNMAQVHRAMGNQQKAEQCLKCLLSQLVYHTHGKAGKVGKFPGVFDCFYQSITGLIMEEKGFAPAA